MTAIYRKSGLTEACDGLSAYNVGPRVVVTPPCTLSLCTMVPPNAVTDKLRYWQKVTDTWALEGNVHQKTSIKQFPTQNINDFITCTLNTNITCCALHVQCQYVVNNSDTTLDNLPRDIQQYRKLTCTLSANGQQQPFSDKQPTTAPAFPA